MQEANDTECYGLESTMTTAIVNEYWYTCVQMKTTNYTWQQLLQIHQFTEVNISEKLNRNRAEETESSERFCTSEMEVRSSMDTNIL